MPTQSRTALPVLVAHSAVLQVPAVVMSIVGGPLMYGTIISFGRKIYDDVEESVGSVRSKDARGEGVSGSRRIHREEVRKVAAQ
jgi:Vacuolar protein sorting 55